jgi:hypothetical protein
VHSSVVGGSTASRVINCPGSVALVQRVPPSPSSSYADVGTLLHGGMADLLNNVSLKPEHLIGRTYKDQVLTEEMVEEKIKPALAALNEIDPDETMSLEVEQVVSFGDLIPGAFGSADVVGRRGKRAIIIDWKFGDGVPVHAEGNLQLLFYAAAAARTPSLRWVFDGVKELELVIVQPPHVRRWVTDMDALENFELNLVRAVRLSERPDAPLEVGSHCRWCPAKPICPKMTGAIDRLVHNKLESLEADQLSAALMLADKLEDFIAAARKLAFDRLEKDMPVPGYKLVPKRAVRQWVDENKAFAALSSMGIEPYEQKLLSPAQAEKALKKSKLTLPDDLVVAVSSGSTIAPESDPRPAVLNLGTQLVAALSKIQ